MPSREIPSSSLARDLSKFDWPHFDPKSSALCLPAMALALALGLFFHQSAAGIIAASGTFSVGFASFRRVLDSRLLPMLLTALGMGMAGFIGTLAGHLLAVTTLAVGILGLVYGLLLIFSEDASWIALQSVIAFLVASAFPAYGWHALIRGSLVLTGGLLQIALLLVLWHGTRIRSLRDDFRNCHPENVFRVLWNEMLPILLRQIDHRLPMMRYAVRLCLTLMLATALSHRLHQTNAYWLPMTTLIVMKPDFYRTYTSSFGRVFGTFLGVIVASLLTWGLHPGQLLLCGLVLAFAWASFSSQKINYPIFSCVLTAFIVFLVAIYGLPEITLTANRLLDTALGSIIGLGSRAIGPKWDSVPAQIAGQGLPHPAPQIISPSSNSSE